MKLVRTKVYERTVKAILTLDEQTAVEDDIAHNAKNYPVIPGTGGIRKARAARGNKGKRGGARIIFFFWQVEDTIFLLAAYAKNEKENLSDDDAKKLRALVEELKKIEREANNV